MICYKLSIYLYTIFIERVSEKIISNTQAQLQKISCISSCINMCNIKRKAYIAGLQYDNNVCLCT